MGEDRDRGKGETPLVATAGLNCAVCGKAVMPWPLIDVNTFVCADCWEKIPDWRTNETGKIH